MPFIAPIRSTTAGRALTRRPFVDRIGCAAPPFRNRASSPRPSPWSPHRRTGKSTDASSLTRVDAAPFPTRNSGGRAARLYSLCSVDFSPALLLPRRPIRRSYALHRPASFCTTVRCYKLAAAQLYCGAYNKAVGCPEARLSHPRIQRSYALYPPGVCDRLGCILPLPPSETRTFARANRNR